MSHYIGYRNFAADGHHEHDGSVQCCVCSGTDDEKYMVEVNEDFYCNECLEKRFNEAAKIIDGTIVGDAIVSEMYSYTVVVKRVVNDIDYRVIVIDDDVVLKNYYQLDEINELLGDVQRTWRERRCF